MEPALVVFWRIGLKGLRALGACGVVREEDSRKGLGLARTWAPP